jgi:hypothetical protein
MEFLESNLDKVIIFPNLDLINIYSTLLKNI